MKHLPSCLPSGWGELVSKIESNMPFFTCVCPHAYALVKTRLKEPIESYWLSHTRILFMILQVPIGSYWLSPTKILFRILREPIASYWLSPSKIPFRILQEPIGSYWLSPTKILFRILQELIGNYWLIPTKILSRILQEPIECFHMTSRRPYWFPKTMKRRPCWCPKQVLWDLNLFLCKRFLLFQ